MKPIKTNGHCFCLTELDEEALGRPWVRMCCHCHKKFDTDHCFCKGKGKKKCCCCDKTQKQILEGLGKCPGHEAVAKRISTDNLKLLALLMILLLIVCYVMIG